MFLHQRKRKSTDGPLFIFLLFSLYTWLSGMEKRIQPSKVLYKHWLFLWFSLHCGSRILETDWFIMSRNLIHSSESWRVYRWRAVSAEDICSPCVTGRSYNSVSGLRDRRALISAPREWIQSCYHGINPFVVIETLCTNPPLKGLLSQHCCLSGHSGQTWQPCPVLWSFSWLFGYVSTVASTLGLSLAVTIYSRPCPPALVPWEHFCSLIISWCWYGLDNLTVSWSPLECIQITPQSPAFFPLGTIFPEHNIFLTDLFLRRASCLPWSPVNTEELLWCL